MPSCHLHWIVPDCAWTISPAKNHINSRNGDLTAARKFGVYTPMPTAKARKLCPKLIVLPGDYERYEQFSRWMFGYAYDFPPDVEQTSIDEGYFDLTANRKKPAIEIAQIIRKAIGQSLKITVSEGIASNKLISLI
jgi:nucleotidyltransferase/DNA polymerase involved in DNA repair